MLGGEVRERVVEVDLEDARHPECGQGGVALGRHAEPERRVLRPEQLARMRLEGQHAERHVRPGGMQRPQQVRVAAMHAVEVT